MSRYRLTEAAAEDVIAIYIQGYDLFGPVQADRYQDELTELFERLARSPRLAWLRTDYQPPVRVYAHRSHVVIYEEDDEGVVIVRVRHGHEDWQANPRGDQGEED